MWLFHLPVQRSLALLCWSFLGFGARPAHPTICRGALNPKFPAPPQNPGQILNGAGQAVGMRDQFVESTQEPNGLARIMRAIVDGAPEGIFTLDSFGRITYANVAAEPLLGYGRANLLGAHVADVVCARSLPRHSGEADIDYLTRLDARSNNGGDVPVGIIRPDGTMRRVRLSVSYISGRRSAALVCYLRDIDDRQQAIDAAERRRTEQNPDTATVRMHFASLTPREREVMALVTVGLRNKQVGHELGISEITVKAHRGKVMRKMHATSLAHLVNLSRYVGLSSARMQ